MNTWEHAWINPPRKKTARKKPRKREEEDVQVKVCVFLDKLGILYHAIPNGGKRPALEAFKMKRTGLKPGVPDLFIAEPRGAYHGFYIELKKPKGGVVSDVQKYWIAELRRKGFKAEVHNGHISAIQAIEEYLKC